MTDLSTVLRTLVDRPTAPPDPVEEVVARSRRVRARRRWIQAGSAAAAAVGLLAGFGALITRDDPGGTTVALGGDGTESAGYLAVAPGGYEGAGIWRLTIVRHGETIEFTSETSAPCGSTGVIQPGDEVRGEIRSGDSVLRAGEDAHC